MDLISGRVRHLNSGSIGINITRNQDTAWPLSLQLIAAQETALPCPQFLEETALPCSTINRGARKGTAVSSSITNQEIVRLSLQLAKSANQLPHQAFEFAATFPQFQNFASLKLHQL